MLLNQRNWAYNSIDLFFSLIHKYYSLAQEEGIFFDIGANIGTTAIYVKKYHPDLDVIAFEPGADNFDLLQVNSIINRVPIKMVNKGLADYEGESNYIYNSENSGGSGLSESGGEVVSITTFDRYVMEMDIHPTQIYAIWMDTEGYEVDAILGSIKTLSHRRIPLFIEYSPYAYLKKGNKYEQWCQLMESVYDHFIDANRDIIFGDSESIYDISELKDYYQRLDPDNFQTDLFFF